MKRRFLISDYISEYVSGSNGHKNIKSFMATAMMNIPKNITIDNSDILYYQNINGEQVSLDNEMNSGVIVYNTSSVKETNAKLYVNAEQSAYQRDNNTLWDLAIDYKVLLMSYIFTNIKRSRAFESILNSDVVESSVDLYIKNYISDNILDKYKVTQVKMYLEYIDITKVDGYYRYGNVYDTNLLNANSVICPLLYDNNKLVISFYQKENSKNFIFKYYYNISYSIS